MNVASNQPINTEAKLLSACEMVTAHGRVISLRDPKPENIFLDDIAHHLSMLCRYSGAVRRFYSVAEHSYLCSVDPRLQTVQEQRAHLLHDAAEAYLGDIISPVRRLMRSRHEVIGSVGVLAEDARSCYDRIEDRLRRVIEVRFGIDEGALDDCRVVDLSMCMAEQRDLRVLPPEWAPSVPPAEGVRFECYSPEYAKTRFLGRAAILGLS